VDWIEIQETIVAVRNVDANTNTISFEAGCSTRRADLRAAPSGPAAGGCVSLTHAYAAALIDRGRGSA
jgi:hypothetical protein